MTLNDIQKQESTTINGIPYQAIVEQSLVGIYLIQDGLLKYCNDAFAKITGHTVEQLINTSINSVVSPNCIDHVIDNIQQRISKGVGASTRYLTQSIHVDGSSVDIEVHGRTIFYNNKPAIAGVAVNVTQQLDFERDLQKSNSQLKEMSRYINKLRGQRSQEMARDIHDVLGGLLTSIKMSTVRLLNRNNSAHTQIIADDIMSLTQECIEFARNKSEQLYPSTLKYLGLQPALENLLSSHKKLNQLEYTLSFESPSPELQYDLALLIYRIVQESLTNIIRHAKADQVDIKIRYPANQLTVQIQDNGTGFDITKIRDGACGLLYMKERASEFEGKVTITSDTQKGTCLLLTLPLSETSATGSPSSE